MTAFGKELSKALAVYFASIGDILGNIILVQKLGETTMATDWRELKKEAETLLPEWIEECRVHCGQGRVADYIPELGKADKNVLGVTIHHLSGDELTAGDCDFRFTMQSISKVFTLLLALMDQGEKAVFEKVGMEPTGDYYNSLLKLEMIKPGKPFNPLINAGAITIASLIKGATPDERVSRILSFLRRISGDSELAVNTKVYRSEAETSDRNRSLAYLLKDNGVLTGDVEEHLDVYFRHCSIEVSCSHLARMATVLADNGRNPLTGEQMIPSRCVQIAKTFMVTCGMYNASGEFAIRVGLPAKSGVSGGILALKPGHFGIGVIGPALDDKGNSIAGVRLLQRMSEQWKLSIF
jgi:glutaminase